MPVLSNTSAFNAAASMHSVEPNDEVMNTTSSFVLPGYVEFHGKSIIKNSLQLCWSLDVTWTRCKKQFTLNSVMLVDEL